MGNWGSSPGLVERRGFGEYRCSNCGLSWMSANSWEGFYQECRNCRTKVYAHRRSPLEKPDGLDKIDPKKHHRAELCEKCIQLGYNCSNN